LAASENWYDYPQYFDLAFRDENELETTFFEAAFDRYLKAKPKRLLEPGCNSGRLVVAMASRGYHITALDLSEPAIVYCRKRLARRGLLADVFVGDMTTFRLERKVDAAFCTFNTFRHLTTESLAKRHLQAMARAVRKGGIYILGLHLMPPGTDPDCTERYRAKSGKTEVVFTLRVLKHQPRLRLEQMRVTMLVRGKGAPIRCRTEFALRTYTAKQLLSLFASVKQWELVGVYDFQYDLEQPRQIDNDLADALFILKRV
jgi:SAM-dependent methyltransferase